MNREELADLYTQFGHLVYLRCLSILRNEAAAKDVLQEVFVRALRYQHSLDRSSCRLRWLYRTAERCCFDRIKKEKREVPVMPEVLSRVAQDGLPDAAAEAREVVLAFLSRFEPKVQQVAVLHYLDGLPQEEIATQLGWSRRTVGKKLTLLRQRARALAQSMAVSVGGVA